MYLVMNLRQIRLRNVHLDLQQKFEIHTNLFYIPSFIWLFLHIYTSLTSIHTYINKL